jgi:hypothetical protein
MLLGRFEKLVGVHLLKNFLLVSLLSQMNPVLKRHCYIILSSMHRSSWQNFSFMFSNQNFVYVPCCMPNSSHPLWFDRPNNSWQGAWFMKLTIEFSQHLISLLMERHIQLVTHCQTASGVWFPYYLHYCISQWMILRIFVLWVICHLFAVVTVLWGGRSSVVVKALWYKPEGRGFDTR